ncbi:hypothetical protein CPC08DRAFT_340405 [Agrocybe pediades]|nr:hypothetical protein CPC08DRAFT_340405 [Agrocybe pediades]
MSKNNQSRSGLGTVQRDFGPSSSLPPPKSSQEIPWPPTPPAAPAQPTRVLSASEKRLKQIQDALAGYSKPEPSLAPVTAAAPLRNSTTTNKRPSPTGESSADVPLPKRTKRILPPDWHHNDALSRSSGFTTSSKSSSSIGQTSSTTSTVSTAPASKGKLPTIFLSQEQTQILRLVQEGDSVFYTGSAGTGKSVLLREIIKTLRKKFVKTPDAIAITASTGMYFFLLER